MYLYLYLNTLECIWPQVWSWDTWVLVRRGLTLTETESQDTHGHHFCSEHKISRWQEMTITINTNVTY